VVTHKLYGGQKMPPASLSMLAADTAAMIALRQPSSPRNYVFGFDVVAFCAIRFVVLNLAVVVRFGMPRAFLRHNFSYSRARRCRRGCELDSVV